MYEQQTGQVFTETVVALPVSAAHEHGNPLSARVRDTVPWRDYPVKLSWLYRCHGDSLTDITHGQSSSDAGSTRSLQTMATACLLRNLHTVDHATLQDLPTLLVRRIWASLERSYVTRVTNTSSPILECRMAPPYHLDNYTVAVLSHTVYRKLDSLRAWQLLAPLCQSEEVSIRTADCIHLPTPLQKPPHPLSACLDAIHSSPCHWLTSVTLTGSTCDVYQPEFSNVIGKLDNLIVLQLVQPLSLDDRLIMQWGRQALEAQAFPRLKGLFIIGKTDLSSKSFHYLNHFPALEIFALKSPSNKTLVDVPVEWKRTTEIQLAQEIGDIPNLDAYTDRAWKTTWHTIIDISLALANGTSQPPKPILNFVYRPESGSRSNFWVTDPRPFDTGWKAQFFVRWILDHRDKHPRQVSPSASPAVAGPDALLPTQKRQVRASKRKALDDLDIFDRHAGPTRALFTD